MKTISIVECTSEEKFSLASGRCPDCGGLSFFSGPEAGSAVNVKCAGCSSEFNIVPGHSWFAERINVKVKEFA